MSTAAETCSAQGVCIKAITHPLTISEGPHWDIANQRLYFVDIIDQTLWCWNSTTEELTNAYIKNGMLGVAIPVAGKENTFVGGAGVDFVEIAWDPTTNSSDPKIKVLATVDSDRNGTRFNDGKIDPKGRFWGGTMAMDEAPGEGSLYRIGTDMVPKSILRNATISNGLTWSHDNKTFYYIDSPTKQVHAYDYDEDSGEISNMRVLFDFVKNNVPGVPDGMTIDYVGNLWVACYNGHRVLCVDSLTGKLVRTIMMPVRDVTSVAFGGPNLDTLYVTTARKDLSAKDLESQPQAGSVFAVTGLGINGSPMLAYRMARRLPKMVLKIYKKSGITITFCITLILAILIYFYLIRTKTRPTTSSTLKRPGKLIIDTDAGGDDAGAILLALQAEKHARKNGFEVIAITCVYGNTNLTNVESNVRKILSVANRVDIPVYSGAQKPLVKNHTQGSAYGEDGLGDFDFEGKILGEIDRSKHASLRLIDLAREHKGNISVVALGPLTNVALAISLDPDFVYNVERFYVTGSRVDGVKSNEVAAEFNFYQDPHSTFVVFNFTRGLPVVSLPWKSALSAAISKKWRANVLGAMDSRPIKFLNKIEAGSPEEPAWRPADMMITASILWPDLITQSRLTNVSPVYDGSARGSVSVDRSDGPGKNKNAIIIEAFNVEGFKKVLLDTFSQ